MRQVTIMKRKRGGILMLLLAVMLTAGCGKSDLDEDGVMQYLKQRYGGDFTRISTEQIPRAQRQYLDSRMEPVATRESDRNCDDIADVYEDADGLSFHVYHYFRYGVAGSWVVTDDYCVQWLMAKPELCTPLTDSAFPCRYRNTIGMEEDRSAGFFLTVSSLADIRPAAELVYEVLGRDAAILPDQGLFNDKQEQSEHNFWTMAIIPTVTLVTQDGEVLESVRFRTKQVPQLKDLENLIRSAQCRYIELVNKGEINEALPQDVRAQTYADRIPVYLGEQQIAELVTGYWRSYQILDNVPLHEKMEFSQLKAICEACGWRYEPSGSKLRITKGEDSVVITRRTGKGYDRSIFTVMKNGTPFLPEGELDDHLQEDCCQLSLADLKYLFGITVTVDYEAGRAVLRTD